MSRPPGIFAVRVNLIATWCRSVSRLGWEHDRAVPELGLLRADKIHPVVAERLPLTDARRAHELLERSAAKGKLVLVP